MTCQIILANGYGVAIASDTTVTIGSDQTFTTVSKVHPLPSPHCLAVLHAGGVNFHDTPHGVLLGEWIRSLGSVQLRHIDAYRESWIHWLRDNMDRVSPH